MSMTLFATLPRISPENCPALFFVPHPIVRPEAIFPSVQPVSAWRRQAKAEKGAGFVSNQSYILIPSFQCSICEVWIGRRHTEQELYLLPVINQDICVGDDEPEQPTHFDYALLYACGYCARRRQLPESHLVVPASTWETVTLLKPKDIQPQVQRFEQEVLPGLCTEWGVSYETVMAHLHPPSKKPGQAHVQKEERREEKHEERMAPITSPTSLSSLLAAYHAQLPRLPAFTKIAI